VVTANVSSRKQACNQSPGPAGSFLTRNRSLPTTAAGYQLEASGREADAKATGRGAPKPAPLPPTWRSPRPWPIQSTTTTALTLSQLRSLWVLAAAIVFLLAELVPQVVDLMIDRPIAHLYGTGQHAGLAPGLRKSSSGRRAGVP
jgi:hypothetical protein